MPKVTYVEHNGIEHTVDVPVGTSVMRGAVDNNVPGIDADCGGECACATCHVYVDAEWLPRIGTPAPGSQEAAMLSFAAVAQPEFAAVVSDQDDARTRRAVGPHAGRATLNDYSQRGRHAGPAIANRRGSASRYPAQAITRSFSQIPRQTHSPSCSMSR